ncbi:MAG: hypothetical protein U0836_13660 [Pirellulales bacterium]
MNDLGLLIAALVFIVGGTINLFFPDFAIGISRDLNSTLRTDKGVPSALYSRELFRLVGASALGLGILLVIVWLVLARRG